MRIFKRDTKRGSGNHESEPNARAIFVDGSDFSGLYRAGGGPAAHDRTFVSAGDAYGKESRRRLGRAFRGASNANANAHSAGNTLHGAGAAPIRAQLAREVSARAPLVGACFSGVQRGGGRQRVEAGARKNNWRTGRESSSPFIWNVLF